MNALVTLEPRTPKLNDTQLALYKILCEAVEKNEVITKQQIIDAYKANCNTEWCVPKYVDGVRQWGWEPMPTNYLEGRAIQWFKYCLGVFVVKGYCVVLPKFKFTDVDPKAIKQELQ